MTTTETTTFVPGAELSCRSFCDYDCEFRFTVISRTAKTVTLDYYGETKRVKIRTTETGREYCLPLGTYSMSPVLYAR